MIALVYVTRYMNSNKHWSSPYTPINKALMAIPNFFVIVIVHTDEWSIGVRVVHVVNLSAGLHVYC